MRTESADSLIDSIYPAINSTPPPPPDYFLNRMILAPRNINVGEINQEILDRMAGDSHQYISADEIIREPGADPETMNQFQLNIFVPLTLPVFHLVN